MPTVSVVISAYNRPKHLKRAIGSVLNQRFEDFELIVVDDGSTNDIRVVVEGFDDPRVRYLAHRTNKGGSAARNTGIEASQGKYVAFLDDDDEWHPHKLDRQVECLEGRSDEWVAAYCDFRVVRPGDGLGSRLRKHINEVWSGGQRSRLEGGKELIPTVLRGQLPLGGASTLMIQRNAIDQLGGFDPGFQRHQDWEFLIRLLRIGKLAYVDELLVMRHVLGRPSADAVEAGKDALFAKFPSEIANAERNGYDIVGIHRFGMAKYYFMEGRFAEGIEYLSGAKINPRGLLRTSCIGTYSKLAQALQR